MPKAYNLSRLGSERYTELKHNHVIKPISNQIKREKLIIGGSIRQTFSQDEAPFCIWRADYDPNLDPMSWKSIIARRASFDPLMEGGNNNENRKDKATNKIKR